MSNSCSSLCYNILLAKIQSLLIFNCWHILFMEKRTPWLIPHPWSLSSVHDPRNTILLLLFIKRKNYSGIQNIKKIKRRCLERNCTNVIMRHIFFHLTNSLIFCNLNTIWSFVALLFIEDYCWFGVCCFFLSRGITVWK